MAGRVKLILASGSPRRLALLDQLGIEPDRVMPVTVDETPRKSEIPRNLAKRLAEEKAKAAVALARSEPELNGALIIAADTVVSVGRRIFGKAETIEEAATFLRVLSGRAHRVHTGVVLVAANGHFRRRLVESRVRFKRLSRDDVDSYLASGEWRGKAGAYAVQGIAGAFVVKLIGSYSNVVGLPLYETMALLTGEGYPVHLNWLSAS